MLMKIGLEMPDWYVCSAGRLSKKKYGVQPKFVKMRELHSLLFYLTHCYAGQPDLDQKQLLGKHHSPSHATLRGWLVDCRLIER